MSNPEQHDDIFTAVIAVLEQQKASGVQSVALAPQTLVDLQQCHTQPPPAASRQLNRPRRQPAAPAPAPLAVAAPVGEVVQPQLDLDGMGWDELASAVAACRRCALCAERRQPVFGTGNHAAELMFIGESPGEDEDQRGEPFMGPAGELLTKMIAAMQLHRDDVYIAEVVKCRAPDDRNPAPDEISCCLPFLQRQINLVKPKALVLLGAVPLQALLGLTGISRIHGQWHDYQGIMTMATFHPAYLLRVPAGKRAVWEDLQKVMQHLGLR